MTNDEICMLLIADCKKNNSQTGYENCQADYIDELEYDSNPSDYDDDLDDMERAELKGLQEFNNNIDKLKREYPWYDFSKVRPGDNLGIVECDARLFQDYLFYE